MSHILRIDASARGAASTTRRLTDRLVERLVEQGYGAAITTRDLVSDPAPPLSEAWVGANFTDEAARSDEQRAALAVSDVLIAELEAADTIVIGVPVYNFAIPAALKAWVDQIARARRTFRYTATGPEGLLTGKKAFLLFASGGVPVGSEQDFASTYMRHILGFVGISDVHVIAADRQLSDDEAIDRALAAIGEVQQAA